ncbi:5-deoxy-glucuronate isomerase [Acetohalobium arabaticum]|uniref:5-deoxyglucuronate isomerase n=1 Tax=Acetohalobium arabaticum (strain ATCC 49924 / DSM 5501 / Z-7288) TaxID=574087 RepID=D9QPN6_ACEAZ|nr:5-deoxy-glucuronate isomerase [Acetohalobium arabaticum]ADL12477.1 5-deoxyglucuronate isomerase [Acetohalobium arabaticum DSM 5501]
MSNLYRFEDEEGYQNIITEDNSDMKYLNFDRILLEAGDRLEHKVEDRELAIVLQDGDFTATVECENSTGLEEVKGVRYDVFDQLPTAIYIPPKSSFKLETETGMEARVYAAPCNEGGAAHFVKPEDLTETMSGAKNWRRSVRVIFGPESDITQKLIVGESVSNPGSWIGFPAHKHDTESDDEYPLEEIFSFKLQGAHGAFAVHHTFNYEEGWDESHIIDDENCAVAIPKGYHTSQAAPGCRYYLLWGLAGKEKVYKLTFDPRFKWLQDAETLFEESVGRELTDVMVGKVK